MKIFLDDFTMYSDMESQLQKLRLCFQKCREYDISMNLDKCAFMVFSRMILGFIISKEGKLPNPKKIQTIINMPPPKNPQQIMVSLSNLHVLSMPPASIPSDLQIAVPDLKKKSLLNCQNA
jgi:hypothetical protein